MAKITPKVFITGIAICLFTVITGTCGYRVFLTLTKTESNPSDQKTEITYYNISKEIPPEVSQEIRNFADSSEWSETSDTSKAGVHVTIGTPPTNTSPQSESTNLYIFQVWALTKPWNKLADTNLKTVTSISDKIHYSEPQQLLGKEFTIETKNTGVEPDNLRLETLQELDGTRISVQIEGKDLFDKDIWKDTSYPLIFTIEISGTEQQLEQLRTHIQNSSFYSTNGYLTQLPEAKDIVSVIKTGTSVAGGPGWELCERTKGNPKYPILEVEDFLKEADLTIISNESSFIEGCTQGAGTTAFCGKPQYFSNLTDAGIDIVSLTGNHMADYGRTSYQETMELYTQNDISYFSAGKNSTDAWEPLLVETPAGIIAFLGFNKMGPPGVTATETLPGTAYYEKTLLETAMAKASETADIIWVDTHLWPEYGTTAGNDQILHSYETVELGANIVTGVSSHEIQSIETYNDAMIFYGLGNFLFDQMWSTETRQGIVLKVHIYDKSIRNIEIHPTMVYDYCQPRFLETNEKKRILDYLTLISN